MNNKRNPRNPRHCDRTKMKWSTESSLCVALPMHTLAQCFGLIECHADFRSLVYHGGKVVTVALASWRYWRCGVPFRLEIVVNRDAFVKHETFALPHAVTLGHFFEIL
jgi:hypothetical protein